MAFIHRYTGSIIYCYALMNFCIFCWTSLSDWCSMNIISGTGNSKSEIMLHFHHASYIIIWVHPKWITLAAKRPPSASDNWSSKAPFAVVKDCLPVLNLLRGEVLKVLHVISMLVKVVVQTPVLLEVILQLVLHVLQERQIPAATSLPFTSNSWSKPGMSLSRWPLACRSSMSQPRASKHGTSRRRGRSMVTGPDRGMYFGKQIFQLGS